MDMGTHTHSHSGPLWTLYLCLVLLRASCTNSRSASHMCQSLTLLCIAFSMNQHVTEYSPCQVLIGAISYPLVTGPVYGHTFGMERCLEYGRSSCRQQDRSDDRSEQQLVAYCLFWSSTCVPSSLFSRSLLLSLSLSLSLSLYIYCAGKGVNMDVISAGSKLV